MVKDKFKKFIMDKIDS